MAYDVELADRIRELVQDQSGIVEKKMFGGLAFLVNGNMAVAAAGKGGLMVRSDPAQADDLVDDIAVSRMEMHGRSMGGWLRVSPAACADDAIVRRWVAHGIAYAGTLPAK